MRVRGCGSLWKTSLHKLAAPLPVHQQSGFLPLHEAALAGQADAVETLIALGAKLSDVIPVCCRPIRCWDIIFHATEFSASIHPQLA